MRTNLISDKEWIYFLQPPLLLSATANNNKYFSVLATSRKNSMKNHLTLSLIPKQNAFNQ
jgi:hypothetical protein